MQFNKNQFILNLSANQKETMRIEENRGVYPLPEWMDILLRFTKIKKYNDVIMNHGFQPDTYYVFSQVDRVMHDKIKPDNYFKNQSKDVTKPSFNKKIDDNDIEINTKKFSYIDENGNDTLQSGVGEDSTSHGVSSYNYGLSQAELDQNNIAFLGTNSTMLSLVATNSAGNNISALGDTDNDDIDSDF